MKVLEVKEHSFLCNSQIENAEKIYTNSKKNDSDIFIYELSKCHILNEKRHFLFYHKNNFYLVIYNACLEHGEKYKFLESILNGAFNSKGRSKYSFERSCHYADEFKKQRLYGAKIEEQFTEINYLYADNAGKPYAITTKGKYWDYDNRKLNDNFFLAEEKLKEIGLDFLIPQLERLASENLLIEPCDKEVYKSVNQLIKQIKKESNEK